MSIVGRTAGEVGFTRASLPMHQTYSRGIKVAMGTYWLSMDGILASRDDADTVMIYGEDKRLLEIRAAISPKLTTGKATIKIFRSSDEGVSVTDTGLAVVLDSAARMFSAKPSAPLALKDKDLLFASITTDFEFNHRVTLQYIFD